MKVGVAQTRPATGDIGRNIQQHKTMIARAIASGADILIFPELSLTGYEPSLAHSLAVDPDDKRLDEFQQISDKHILTIGAGIPTRSEEGIYISMILFQPGQPRQVYSKRYLHADEKPFFIEGKNASNRIGGDIALAICYEISEPQHVEEAFAGGAKIYIASVVKIMHGIDKAFTRLSEIGSAYAMTVLLSNSVGPADGYECAGRSAIWDNKGKLRKQLDMFREGILLLDTETGKIDAL